MLSHAWPLLALLSACSSDGPFLESTQVSDDFVHATYSGACGEPRLSWTGSLDFDTHEAPLHLNYERSGDDGDCTREVVFDLRPIRDTFLAGHADGGKVQLLVPEDSSNDSFSNVDYFPTLTRECAAAGSAVLVTDRAAEAFAAKTALDFKSCGRDVAAREARCCEATTAGYDCLLDGLAACSPTRFGLVSGTLEGDPIISDYFVVPAGEGCDLFVVTDRSQDTFRGVSTAPTETIRCDLASLSIVTPGECPSLTLGDCGL